MNSFFGKKGSANDAKKPVIRKETVLVKKTPTTHSASASPQPGARRPGPPANRFQLSNTTKTHAPAPRKPLKSAAQRAVEPRGVKRKSATPQPEGPIFSSDDDASSSESGASDSDIPNKRIKSSVSSIGSAEGPSGPRRKLVSETLTDEGKGLRFVHACKLTSGDQAPKFVEPWDEDVTTTVKLQYPSRSDREKFELKWPKSGSDEYKPMDDVAETIKHVCKYYLPSHINVKGKYTDPTEPTSFERRFQKAWLHEDISEFAAIVEDYNSLIMPLISDNTIRTHLSRRDPKPDLDWIKRILDQIYARTVSPRVETLRAYDNGTDNVYGELLPPFVSKVLQTTALDHTQVFVDLGSGVGNVVLQAALEVGCESHGIECMPNPCALADLQAAEFPARARLWGLNVGSVNLIRGDFTENAQIGEILKRADVVLVNNQAFTAQLNEVLISMFLDLKEGCQVVSLKPFVPKDHKISMRNLNSPVNCFVQKKAEYFSGSVSWTDREGFFYHATKDSGPLRAFKRRFRVD